MVHRTPTARKASKDSASAAAKVAAAAAAAVTTSAAASAAVPLGRSPGADSLIDSRMLARDVTVRCALTARFVPITTSYILSDKCTVISHCAACLSGVPGTFPAHGSTLLQRAVVGHWALPCLSSPGICGKEGVE